MSEYVNSTKKFIETSKLAIEVHENNPEELVIIASGILEVIEMQTEAYRKALELIERQKKLIDSYEKMTSTLLQDNKNRM